MVVNLLKCILEFQGEHNNPLPLFSVTVFGLWRRGQGRIFVDSLIRASNCFAMQGGSLGPPIIEQIVNKVEANLAPFGHGRRSVWTELPRHLATLSGCEDVAWDCSMSAHRSRRAQKNPTTSAGIDDLFL